RWRGICDCYSDSLSIPKTLDQTVEGSARINDSIAELVADTCRDGGRRIGELTRQRGKLQFLKQLVGGGTVRRSGFDLIQIQIHLKVKPDARQLARLTNQVGVVAQRFTVSFVFDFLPT